MVAVLHGWFVAWLTGAVGEADIGVGMSPDRVWTAPEHAMPVEIEAAQLERAVARLRRDPYGSR